MEMNDTKYEHIAVDENGVAFIKKTTTKVIEIIVEQTTYGWSPEEIHFQHPYLSLGQIHSAFAYYWDHREQMNQELLNRQNITDDFKTQFFSSSLQDKLKTKKAV